MCDLENDDNQSDGSQCPTCGETFADDHAMKTHHGHAHGESIAGVEVECPWCGGTRRVKPSYAEANENIFCDEDCYGAWLSGRETGEDHPLYDRVEVECAWCDSPKLVQPHRAERNRRHFCDPGCWGSWSQANRVGEDAPAWDGGAPGSRYYGPSWETQREKAIQRDNRECALCNLSRADHRKRYGSDLHVHHKTPFYEYGVENHEEANRLENLIALCNSCHPQMETVSRKRTA